jgi:tetratricopeptide (TPR) repeat protein
LNYQFKLLAPAFNKLYENETFALYEVQDLSATHTITGNTYLLEENWHDAIDEFNTALAANQQDAAAYFGLGRAHFALGNWDEAVVNYRRAMELSPSAEGMLQHVDLGIEDEYLPMYLAFGDNYPTPGPALGTGVVTYDFLANLPLTDQEAEPHRTVFIINGEPRAVLFQHPPSQLDFQVMVPPAGQLQFDLALSTAVWQLGAGDGVEFTVKLDAGMDTFVLFSEYIDPKNIPSQRQWNERSIDLSLWGGQVVTITLETSVGPNGDASNDWAGWGQPLVVQPDL